MPQLCKEHRNRDQSLKWQKTNRREKYLILNVFDQKQYKNVLYTMTKMSKLKMKTKFGWFHSVHVVKCYVFHVGC